MKRIAVYGKGGIGKSTISSNLTAALADKGIRVMQIGCDPKHDSTRLLTDGARQETVLNYLKDVPESNRRMEDIVETGYKGCLCVEAGGPEPGIGCAGRGIISAFELLQDLGVDTIPLDIMIYDVLGDVVCGGFAVPLRDNYADTVYVVTSGEFMSIYAANNILRGTANYNPDRIGGIIFNSRGDEEERERVERFSKAVGIPVIAEFSRSKEFLEAERIGKTVVEAFPGSAITGAFRELSEKVVEGRKYPARFLSESELESVVLGRQVEVQSRTIKKERKIEAKEKRRYTSRNVHRNEIIHGCAFNGASSVTMSIDGLTTLLHSPRSCAQYSFQMTANSVRQAGIKGSVATSAFVDPSVQCTDMDETAMIFGGAERLQDEIEDLIATGRDSIAVITSCPSGIIGDDVKQAVGRVRANYPKASVMLFEEDGNIRGDFMQGVIDASIGLIKELSVKGLKKERSVNLVGVKAMATNTERNIAVISDILVRMNVTVNCSCVGNTSIESIRHMTSAEICLLLYPDRFAIMLADFLKEEYGMEFARNIIRPGLEETRQWVTEIGTRFGSEKEAEDVMDQIDSEFEDRIRSLKEDLEGRSVYVLGNHKDINWIMETVTRCGMVPQGTVVMDLTDHSKDYEIDVDYPIEYRSYGDLEEIVKDINAKDPELVISTYPLDLTIPAEQCFIPIAPDLGPFSGPELAESWVRMLKAPKEEGWRKDVIRN